MLRVSVLASSRRTRYFHDHVEHNFSLRDEDTFFDAFDVSHGR